MKQILILVLFLSVSPAHAAPNWCSGIFSNFIERITPPDDPSQYEELWTRDLVSAYENLGIKGAWDRLTPADKRTLNVMGGELRWRLQTGFSLIPEDIPLIERALEDFEQFEGYAKLAKGRQAP